MKLSYRLTKKRAIVNALFFSLIILLQDYKMPLPIEDRLHPTRPSAYENLRPYV